MFKKLKEKIADGVEGVSPGRQTPLRASTQEGNFLFKYKRLSPEQVRRNNHINHKKYNSTLDNSPVFNDNSSSDAHQFHKSNPQEVLARVHHLLEVGRAQAQNNGKIEENTDSMPSSPKIVHSLNSSPRHSVSTVDKTDISSRVTLLEHDGPVFESTPNQSFASQSVPSTKHQQRRVSTSSNVSMAEERSDVDSDMDTSRTEHMSINEIRELYRKQDKTLKRYKRKFSEVVDAYKALHKEKEKLETTLTSGQDKQLRRINELKETIELEQEGKRHLEDVLRLNIEEKDDQIQALQTQVQILKTKYGFSSSSLDSDVSSSVAVVNGAVTGNEKAISALQNQLKQLTAETARLKKDNEQYRDTVARFEQEKKTAIEEVMENMQQSFVEQDDLKSELIMLRDELNNRDITILRMREEEEKMETNLRHELSKEITEDTLEEALKQQENELKAIFEEKQNVVKSTFADKVHDLQRVLEENEKQKEFAIQQKHGEVEKLNDQLLVMKEQMEQLAEKEEKFKERMKKLVAEKDEWMKKFNDAVKDIEKEKAKATELMQKHDDTLKVCQDESKEQVAKVKRSMQAKIYELQEQLRKKTLELNETTTKHKDHINQQIKEAQQQMQSDHAKVSRKLEVKVSDMKKMIKELRAKLTEKESRCSELELSLNDIQTEANQYKAHQENSQSLNVSLLESEERVKALNDNLLEKENHRNELEKLLSSLKEEVRTANVQIESLNTVIEDKNNEVLDWRHLHENLSKQIEEQQKDFNLMSGELKQKLVVEEELKARLHNQELSFEELKQSENSVNIELSNLKNELELKDKTIFEKDIMITNFQTNENELVSQLELLRNSSTASQQEQSQRFEAEVENIRNDYMKREKEWQNDMQVYKAKEADLKQEINSLMNDVKSERSVNENLQSELSRVIANLNEMQNKHAEVCENLSQVTLELNNKDAENTNLLQELKASQKTSVQLQQDVANLTLQLSTKNNDVEGVTTHLEHLDKKLLLKEEELGNLVSSKNAEIEALHEKCLRMAEEKETLEESYNQRISGILEEHQVLWSKKENDYYAQLQQKDEEWRAELNKIMNDKDSTAESMNAQLEELRKHEIAKLESRYSLKLENVNNDWDNRIKNLELKHNEQKNKSETEFTEKLSEKEKAIEKIVQEMEFLKNNQKELNDTQEVELSNLSAENERLKHTLAETTDIQLAQIESLKVREKELVEKHSEELQLLQASVKSEIDSITGIHTIEISKYKDEIDSFSQRRSNDFKSLNESHEEDRSILLKQIEKMNFNLDELKSICDRKDQELLREKDDHNRKTKELDEKLNSLQTENENMKVDLTSLKEQLDKLNEEIESYQAEIKRLQEKTSSREIESCEKLQALENLWQEKQNNLEKKYKKIISDRDKKSKSSSTEIESKHKELIQTLEDDFSSKENSWITELNDKEDSIKLLQKELNGATKKYSENQEDFQKEISIYKNREQDAWKQLEFAKRELVSTKEQCEKEISILELKLLQTENTVEEFQIKLMSNESNNKEIDTKLSDLLHQKNELERKLSDTEHSFEERIRHLENENEHTKLHYEEIVRKLTDDHVEKMKETEKEKEEELKSKFSENEEMSKSKLLEMKRKAETKIAKMKKDFSEKSAAMANETDELRQKVSVLEAQLEDEMLSYEKQTVELKENHEKAITERIEQVVTTNNEQQAKALAELTKLRSEVESLTQRLLERDEKIDNMTVDKMDALKSQRADLLEEHQVELKNIREEAQKSIEINEKKSIAKVDEKEFEYSSKIKQMIKEFQTQLSTKDREIQVAIQEAIETAQKDERKLISEYNEQITELEKELRLRERDMVDYQTEMEDQINQLNSEKAQENEKHKAEIEELEMDYRKRVEELMKQHEEVLLTASPQKNASNDDINELQRSYDIKIQDLEDSYQNELKKQKLQLKKTKNEMRKLLVEKGVTLANGEEIEQAASNPGSDVEAESNEVQDLKDKVSSLTKELKSLREREKFLVMQAERSPGTSHQNRPATLQLDDSFNSSNSSSPKTPQPLEFEYLRNILFNYMMGKQRKQMAKVLTALVSFPPNQVKQILAKVEEQETAANTKGYFAFGR